MFQWGIEVIVKAQIYACRGGYKAESASAGLKKNPMQCSGTPNVDGLIRAYPEQHTALKWELT